MKKAKFTFHEAMELILYQLYQTHLQSTEGFVPTSTLFQPLDRIFTGVLREEMVDYLTSLGYVQQRKTKTQGLQLRITTMGAFFLENQLKKNPELEHALESQSRAIPATA